MSHTKFLLICIILTLGVIVQGQNNGSCTDHPLRKSWNNNSVANSSWELTPKFNATADELGFCKGLTHVCCNKAGFDEINTKLQTIVKEHKAERQKKLDTFQMAKQFILTNLDKLGSVRSQLFTKTQELTTNTLSLDNRMVKEIQVITDLENQTLTPATSMRYLRFLQTVLPDNQQQVQNGTSKLPACNDYNGNCTYEWKPTYPLKGFITEDEFDAKMQLNSTAANSTNSTNGTIPPPDISADMKTRKKAFKENVKLGLQQIQDIKNLAFNAQRSCLKAMMKTASSIMCQSCNAKAADFLNNGNLVLSKNVTTRLNDVCFDYIYYMQMFGDVYQQMIMQQVYAVNANDVIAQVDNFNTQVKSYDIKIQKQQQDMEGKFKGDNKTQEINVTNMTDELFSELKTSTDAVIVGIQEVVQKRQDFLDSMNSLKEKKLQKLNDLKFWNMTFKQPQNCLSKTACNTYQDWIDVKNGIQMNATKLGFYNETDMQTNVTWEKLQGRTLNEGQVPQRKLDQERTENNVTIQEVKQFKEVWNNQTKPPPPNATNTTPVTPPPQTRLLQTDTEVTVTYSNDASATNTLDAGADGNEATDTEVQFDETQQTDPNDATALTTVSTETTDIVDNTTSSSSSSTMWIWVAVSIVGVLLILVICGVVAHKMKNQDHIDQEQMTHT